MGSAILDYKRFQRMSPRQRAIEERAMLVVLTFKASLFMLCGCIPLAYYYNISAVCTGVLLWPMIAIGLFLMVIFALGCNGVRHRQDCLKILYIIGLSMTIVALLAFVIFGYIAVGGIDLSPVKVREYNLTEYSRGWLRGRVADPQYWSKISACLHDRHACDAMTQLVRDPETGTFVPKKSWAKDHELGDGPTPIESGCCKPPSSCAFKYVNGTTWTPTPGAPAVETNVDCSRWSNEQQTLCFRCDSCRAGLLHETLKGWSMGAFFPVLVLIALSSSCYYQVKAMEMD